MQRVTECGGYWWGSDSRQEVVFRLGDWKRKSYIHLVKILLHKMSQRIWKMDGFCSVV